METSSNRKTQYLPNSHPLAVYTTGCAMGFASGTIIGAYVGGMVGFTIPAVAPLGFVYGLVKVGRILLRK